MHLKNPQKKKKIHCTFSGQQAGTEMNAPAKNVLLQQMKAIFQSSVFSRGSCMNLLNQGLASSLCCALKVKAGTLVVFRLQRRMAARKPVGPLRAELFPPESKYLKIVWHLARLTQSLLSYCSGQHKNSQKGTKKGLGAKSAPKKC